MMKKFLLVLMIVTLMAGMSLPALAGVQEWKVSDPFCEDPVSIEFPVTMQLMPWARVEFAGELDFEEVGFCGITGYRLFWINSNAFMDNNGGASSAYLPDGTGTWADIDDDIHVNGHLPVNQEVNPRLKITTNTAIDVTFEFNKNGEYWPEELPIYIPIWKMGANYVGAFGRNVLNSPSGYFPESTTVNVTGPGQAEYHLDGGILFDEADFWLYETGAYHTEIMATVALPPTAQ